MLIKYKNFGIFTLVLAFFGCGQGTGRLPTVSVSGKVVEHGKPVANANIIFHPLDTTAVKPRGQTDSQGVFQLTTYDGNDGAPVGQYRVTVELWQTLRPDEGPVSRLPAKYAKPETSGFVADVTPSTTHLPAFEIKK